MPKVNIRPSSVPLAFDDRPLAKRIGLVVLATDHTTEPDFRAFVASDRIGVYTARIAYANPTTPENLRRMQPRLSEGAALILPDEGLDALVYSCTSASVVMGDGAVTEAIAAAKPGVPVLTPPLAARQALRALDARRISVLTPYTLETSRPMADYFEEHGLELLSFSCLDLDDDRRMARISQDSLIEAAREAMAPESEALFISCTALRSAGAAARIEQAIGRPVVTSNQATAWLSLRLCGDRGSRPELGRLLTLPAPETQGWEMPS